MVEIMKTTIYYKIRCLAIAVLAVIMFAPLGWAATYYVNAINGNDSRTGLSEITAWKTIAKVNASRFNPGDQILFKRGEIWRETLVVPSSGVSGNPITFGAYGEGVDPIISGAERMSNWQKYSANVYKTSCPYTPETLWEENQYLSRVNAIDSIDRPGKWYFESTNHTLYLWPIDSSDPAQHLLEIGVRPICISLSAKNYVQISNVILEKASATTKGLLEASDASYIRLFQSTVRYSGYQTYGVNFTGGSHNTLEFCTVHDIRNTAVYFRNGSTYGSVIKTTVYNVGQNTDAGDNGAICFGGTSGGSHYGLIEYSHIYNVGASDTVNYHNQAICIDRSSFCVIRYNKIHDCIKGGIQVGGEKGNHVNTVEIYYNVIYDINKAVVSHLGLGHGIGLFNTDNGKLYNNVIWNIGASYYGLYVLSISGTPGEIVRNIEIKNNIIGPSLGSTYRGHYSTGENVVVIDLTSNNNLFYDSTGLILRKGNQTYYNLLSFQRAVFPNSSKSLQADPKFVSIPQNDFQLQPSSPCIGAGTDVGLRKDILGNDIPPTRIDIGAFQYNNQQLSTPKNLRLAP